MSTIRRQSIISSLTVYFGFALGSLNIFLFTRSFEPAHFGLTTLFISIGYIMFNFAQLGMQAYIFKFYPYYADNLPPEENDMMTWALLVALIGYAAVAVFGIFEKHLVIRKFGEHSADLVTYYYWIIPFALGLTLYLLLESYSLHLKKAILITFLREVVVRFFTTFLIGLTLAGLITKFDIFIKLYAFAYFVPVIILVWTLRKEKLIYFPLRASRVTKKFLSKIRSMVFFYWLSGAVVNLSQVFGAVVIAAVLPKGLESAAIYAVGVYAGSVMQVPQRTLISSAVGPLSRAWKDKDFEKIRRIYRRSSINQLLFSVAVFVLILLNYTDAIRTLGLNPVYLEGLPVFVYIGLMRIVDMGTGLNSQIIGTSSYMKFEFISGMVLMILTLPLNYILTKVHGVTGPAMADLFTFTIYNGIRFYFLWWKFRMQPFTIKTLFTLVLGAAIWLICYFAFHQIHGFSGIVLRSAIFVILFGAGALSLDLSEDLLPVWRTVRKRLGF